MVRELRLPDGGFASAQDADTDGVEGHDLHVDGGRARSGARRAARRLAPAVRARALRPARRDSGRGPRGAPRGARRTRRSRPATTRCSPRGTGSRSPRSPRPGAGSTAPTTSTSRTRSPTSCSGRSPATGRLLRSWRDGVAKIDGYLEDYANVANGLLELYTATGELRRLEEARRLASLAVELFEDPLHGGFFVVPEDTSLVARRKELDDNPTPSGNAMLATVLLRLARLYGDDDLERKAVGVLRLAHPLLVRAPAAVGQLLCVLDFHLAPPREIAIVGSDDALRRGGARRVRAEHRVRLRAGAGPTRSRSSRARTSWTVARPSTSASASPARRP